MRRPVSLTIHLDEYTLRDLEQLKRQIEAQTSKDVPSFSYPELARHAIRKWCEVQAAPVPRPWEAD